jgi:hypothetical protein
MNEPVRIILEIILDLISIVAVLVAIYLIKDDPCAHGAGLAMVGLDGIFLLLFVGLPSILFSWRRGVGYLRKIGDKSARMTTADSLPALTLLACAAFFLLDLPVIFLHPMFPIQWLCGSPR